jgi:hypothetical protein
MRKIAIITMVFGGILGGHFRQATGACMSTFGAVEGSAKHLTGPGHCDGEVVGTLVNRFQGPIKCQYGFKKPDGSLDSGEIVIPANQSRGGEGSGMWTCDGATGFVYQCFGSPFDESCFNLK